MLQLAGDTVAELEAMRAENIQLSSEAVMHDGELQACKHALAKLTTALEVMLGEALSHLYAQAHSLQGLVGGPSQSMMSAEGCSFPKVLHRVS